MAAAFSGFLVGRFIVSFVRLGKTASASAHAFNSSMVPFHAHGLARREAAQRQPHGFRNGVGALRFGQCFCHSAGACKGKAARVQAQNPPTTTEQFKSSAEPPMLHNHQWLANLQNVIGVDAVQLRAWAKLTYWDPDGLIGTLRFFRALTPPARSSKAGVSERKLAKIAQWRVGPLAKYLEREQAAWFCWLLSRRAPDFLWQFSHEPASNYDCILRCDIPGGERPLFKPVQLKELVSSSLNPSTTLQDEIGKLQKYGASPNLVVAIHINRRVTINFQTLKIPPLGIGQLWIFGNASANGEKMFLCGDLLSHPRTDFFPAPPIPAKPPIIPC